MSRDTCFYCERAISNEDTFHPVTFFLHEEEREEDLCPDCYREWLEGMKE